MYSNYITSSQPYTRSAQMRKYQYTTTDTQDDLHSRLETTVIKDTGIKARFLDQTSAAHWLQQYKKCKFLKWPHRR